eukprot:Gb_41348 [translate_table: standard]
MSKLLLTRPGQRLRPRRSSENEEGTMLDLLFSNASLSYVSSTFLAWSTLKVKMCFVHVLPPFMFSKTSLLARFELYCALAIPRGAAVGMAGRGRGWVEPSFPSLESGDDGQQEGISTGRTSPLSKKTLGEPPFDQKLQVAGVNSMEGSAMLPEELPLHVSNDTPGYPNWNANSVGEKLGRSGDYKFGSFKIVDRKHGRSSGTDSEVDPRCAQVKTRSICPREESRRNEVSERNPEIEGDKVLEREMMEDLSTKEMEMGDSLRQKVPQEKPLPKILSGSAPQGAPKGLEKHKLRKQTNKGKQRATGMDRW